MEVNRYCALQPYSPIRRVRLEGVFGWGVTPSIGLRLISNNQLLQHLIQILRHLMAKQHRFSLSGETCIRHVINKNTVQFETLVNSLGGNIQRLIGNGCSSSISPSTSKL